MSIEEIQKRERKERKAFESWFEDNAMPLESNWFARAKDDPEDYALDFVDWAWSGWRAARKAATTERIHLTITKEGVERDAARVVGIPTCESHAMGELVREEDVDCVWCRIGYLSGQETLLQEWQDRATKAEAHAAEVLRPLDAQMARLNDRVVALNTENDRLLRIVGRASQAQRHDSGPLPFEGTPADPLYRLCNSEPDGASQVERRPSGEYVGGNCPTCGQHDVAPKILMQGWQPIATAPKDAREFLLRTKRGKRMTGHWAEGGGEDQPRFGPAWFRWNSFEYVEFVREDPPVEWMPLPDQALESWERSAFTSKERLQPNDELAKSVRAILEFLEVCPMIHQNDDRIAGLRKALAGDKSKEPRP